MKVDIPSDQPARKNKKMKRRTFIKLSAISAAGMVLPLQLEGDAAAMPQLKPRTLITPNADFYILQIGDPVELDAATWRLSITGLTEKRIPPLRLEDITAMESVTAMRTLKLSLIHISEPTRPY